jgi:hypothetical protein
MNERIKELAMQAGLDAKEIREDGSLTLYAFENFDLEQFAELIRQDEREAMRVLLADQARSYQQANDFGSFLALSTLDMTIKARGNHDTER